MKLFVSEACRELSKFSFQNYTARCEGWSGNWIWNPPWDALLGHISSCLSASLMLGCVLHWQWV